MFRSHNNGCQEFLIASTPDECLEVQELIAASLDERRYEQRECFAVRLAVEEALANAVKHGNAGDASKQVHVEFRIDDDEVAIGVADEGGGFSMDDVPDPTLPENVDRPCGRGILLMRSFMTSVKYNKRGNVVALRLRRSQPAPAG